MTKKIYLWKPDSRFSVDPNIVGSALEKIEKRDGVITPIALVDEARADDSPLHQLFEWDDEIAAEKFRVIQAREVTKAVYCTIIEQPRKNTSIDVLIQSAPPARRAFPNVPCVGGYVGRETLATDENRFHSALHLLEQKLAGIQEAIADLEEIAKVDAPDKLQAIAALHEAFRRVDRALSRIN